MISGSHQPASQFHDMQPSPPARPVPPALAIPVNQHYGRTPFRESNGLIERLALDDRLGRRVACLWNQETEQRRLRPRKRHQGVQEWIERRRRQGPIRNPPSGHGGGNTEIPSSPHTTSEITPPAKPAGPPPPTQIPCCSSAASTPQHLECRQSSQIDLLATSKHQRTECGYKFLLHFVTDSKK